MKRLILFVVLGVFAWLNGSAQCNCSGSSSSVSIGETGSSSLSLKKKQWMVEFYGDYRSFIQNQTSHDHSMHMHNHDTASMVSSSNDELNNMLIGSGGIRYGLTNRITLSLQQPYIWLNATPQSTNGFGDLAFIATVRIFDKKEFSGAILAGAEFPTGEKSKLLAENSLTIGSGSYNPIAGLALVKSWQRIFIRANIYSKYGTNGYDNTNFGSTFNYNLTFSHKLKGARSVCKADNLSNEPDRFSWTVFANIAGERYGKQVKENISIKNTGGDMHLMGIGTQLGFRKWFISISFTIPVMQHFQGEQSQTKFRTRIGIIKTF
jgi:hypothetical protein